MVILIAVRTWLPWWKNQRLAVALRSDSKAALGATQKLRSPSPSVNAVARELCLDLAEGKYDIDVLRHIPGKLDTWADALSRLEEPGSQARLPSELSGLQTVTDRRSADWWLTAGLPTVSEVSTYWWAQ